ncbi:MAG: electron transfer flavoprotein subunit beta/FixA family protein [Neisseriaceae bacterium]
MKKILVGAKRVVDANVKVRVKIDNSDVDIEHSKMSLNPFDENAIEEALKLKEMGFCNEIVALSIGNNKCIDTLRTALGRGADRAILVETTDNLEPLMVARVFKYIILKEKPDLIFLGKQAIDDDANQVGQILAGMLNYPQSTFISKLEIKDDKVITTREIDNGTETLEITLPAVLTADLILNEPRFIKLPQLMMAKKKEIEQIPFSNLGIELHKTTRLLKAYDGEQRKQCKFINSVDELFTVLQSEKVI